MNAAQRNNARRAIMISLYVVGKFLATLGLWGALGWMGVREVMTPEIPVHIRLVTFVCGLATLPLYPVWVLGCWLIKVSEIHTKYPFWDMEEDYRDHT